MTVLEQIRVLAAQGIGRLNVEATIGRRLSPDELTAFRKAETLRAIRIAQKKAAGPMSTAERVRKHVAAANDIPPIDTSPRHPRLKESCRFDLERFGWYYCRAILKHRASPGIRDGLIRNVQEFILHGGKILEQYGRGTGKTTWIAEIGITWAILYGHRRYPVLISANSKLARKNLKGIKKLLIRSNEILADFPEVAIPIRAIGGVSQRCASQTYRGVPTDAEWATDQIVLPMLRDESGSPLGPGCGAIVGSVGIGGAVRGANEGGQRPDLLIFDDPQTKKIAHSPTMVADVIQYIHQDALQLAGHDRVLSAFVTITPQCFGDVATELSSTSKHPEWSVTIEPFVQHVCPDWNDLIAEFCAEYVEDAANHDSKFSRSTAWYRANIDRFRDVTVLDPLQFDPSAEVDAIHHILNLRASLGETAFNAEIMMSVADVDTEISINPDLVAKAVNGAPRGTLPPGTDCAVAFCDVNIRKGKGLSYGVVAFGPGRVAAVVAYGRYPERGPLVAPGASDLVRNRAVAAGIREVVRRLSELRLRDTKGRRVTLRAIGFDRGYLPAVVHRALFVIRKTVPLPFPLVAVRGFPWNKFGTRKKDMLRRGDHIFATRSQYGEYLAEMAPYWREIMQSGFLETPLMPGSLSIYGKNPVEHFEFANEICAEKLIRKYVVEQHGRSDTAWDWQTNGDNHYGDVLTGCFAIASWFRCYDALSSVIDATIVSPNGMTFKRVIPRVIHQDDLFDPRQNSAVGQYDEVATSSDPSGGRPTAPGQCEDRSASPSDDDTEGTGVAIPPLTSETDNTSDPLLDASQVPYRLPPWGTPHRGRPMSHKRKIYVK